VGGERSAATPRPQFIFNSETGPLWLNAKALHCVDDSLIEARAAIKDQVAGRLVVGECLTQLLNNRITQALLGCLVTLQ
jgi:hypothetical protein